MSDAQEPAGLHALPETVTLHDGTEVIIRPIRPDDAPRLQSTFHRLSPETIFYRFLGQPKNLADEQAHRLANVDYDSHMAFVAMIGDDVIGVARYAEPNWGEDGVAEAGVIVEDAYQSKGLGTMLLKRLTDYGKAHGIHTFAATIHHSNVKILRFLRHSGLPVERRLDGGLWEVKVRIRDLEMVE
ncbi:MAG: GNAT family N-acetyltransferase [Anaerolineae bacterium]|nr:GNAT family N-acetyltransferase [Anaerolineae bacterium]